MIITSSKFLTHVVWLKLTVQSLLVKEHPGVPMRHPQLPWRARTQTETPVSAQGREIDSGFIARWRQAEVAGIHRRKFAKQQQRPPFA